MQILNKSEAKYKKNLHLLSEKTTFWCVIFMSRSYLLIVVGVAITCDHLMIHLQSKKANLE